MRVLLIEVEWYRPNVVLLALPIILFLKKNELLGNYPKIRKFLPMNTLGI